MKTKTLISTLVVAALASGALATLPALAKGGQNHEMRGQMDGQDMRPSFAELDADSDGNVTIAEMKAFGAKRFGEQDADGNGVLTAEELSAAMVARAAERATNRVERMIEWRDTNGDGGLSQDELSGDGGQRMFAHVDADDDGVITTEEFEAASTQMGEHRGDRKGGHRFGRHSKNDG